MTGNTTDKNKIPRVGVLSLDAALWRKIALALGDGAEVLSLDAALGHKTAPATGDGAEVMSLDAALGHKTAPATGDGAEVLSAPFKYDILILDRRAGFEVAGDGTSGGAGQNTYTDGTSGGAGQGTVIELVERARWREGGAALPYPFAFRELRAVINEAPRGGAARLSLDADARQAILDGERIRLTESECRLLAELLSGGGEFVSREELALRVFGKSAEGGILNVYVHYLREKLEVGGEKIILSSRRGGYKINGKYLGGEV